MEKVGKKDRCHEGRGTVKLSINPGAVGMWTRGKEKGETVTTGMRRLAHPRGCTVRMENGRGCPGFGVHANPANRASGPPAIAMATPGVDGRRL